METMNVDEATLTGEVAQSAFEKVKIRVLPGERVDRKNAAKFVNRAPKTLAIWASQDTGPPFHTAGGRCFYYIRDLEEWISGKTPTPADELAPAEPAAGSP